MVAINGAREEGGQAPLERLTVAGLRALLNGTRGDDGVLWHAGGKKRAELIQEAR